MINGQKVLLSAHFERLEEKNEKKHFDAVGVRAADSDVSRSQCRRAGK
jgi:hypothetical protein